jgi:very-short-patch-repair endonuclease
MGAVLSCGDRAVLSHSSAAALWEIGTERRWVEVSAPVSTRAKRAGLLVHRRAGLVPEDLAVQRGIPVTSPALTILDHACRLGRARIERMINEADKLGLLKPPVLRAFLERHPRREGVGRLKEILDRRAFVFAENELEEAFLPIAESAGLPVPRTQQRLNGFKVDFFWPELGLVVETDGLTYHRTAAAQARDRLRDQTHTAAGLTPLRFTHDQVKYEPGHVRRVLAATVARLAGRRA